VAWRQYALIAACLAMGIAAPYLGIDQEEGNWTLPQDTKPNIATSASAQKGQRSGKFDFYVLALSWSPSYCRSEGADANRQQCGADKDYSFIVHGLWPQFENGYPSRCATRLSDRVPNRLAKSLTDIMPSFGLIGHQWRKHGTCSGLDQQGYFETTRTAFERVTIPREYKEAQQDQSIDPDDVENAFLKANPQLKNSAIAVTCRDQLIREVRICMSKDLEFRSCAEVNKRACRAKNAVMPAAID